MEFEWKVSHLSVSWPKRKIPPCRDKIMSYFSLIFVSKSQLKFSKKNIKRNRKFPSRIFIFTLGFETKISENPFESPSSFYNFINFFFVKALFMKSTTGCTFQSYCELGGNIRAYAGMFNKNYNCSLHPLFRFFIILCAQQLAFMMLFYEVELFLLQNWNWNLKIQ